jgi:predicted metalloprotease
MRWEAGRRSRNIEDRRRMRVSRKATGGGIGDDRLQKQSRGYVTPSSFTHGSSARRVRWLKRGLDRGKLSECNTFEAASL